MVAPLVIAGAVAVATALMQYYNAEKARRGSAKRLKEIEGMFNAIVPPDLNVKIWDDPALVATIPEPAFNLEAVTPEMYERVGQYVPQAAEVIAERRPELVEASQEAKRGRDAQMEALESFRRISRSEFDPELQQKLAEASRKSRADAQSRQASLLQDAARRGQAGSLATMASQMSAGEDSMQRQAVESQMAAAESYRNRLAALQRSSDIGGQVRQSEMSEAAKNADIINDFNQRTSTRYQQAAQQRADLANQAQMFNLKEGQRIADANVQSRNQARYEGIDRGNRLRQQQYANRRTNRQDRFEVEQLKAKYKQQMYDNEMAKAASKAGVGYERVKNDIGRAEGQNAAIGGLGQAGVGMATTYYKYHPDDQQPPPQQPHGGYDYGSTQGNYRRLDDEYWRTS
jgi:hypothetical protein